MKYKIQLRLAENLKRLRKTRKLTQFELAEKADISEAMIKSVELSLAWPSEKTLTQLANALEVDYLNFFLPTTDEEFLNETLLAELKITTQRNFNMYLEKIFSKIQINE